MSWEKPVAQYRFILCNVFTMDRFGGNQLAVLPEAEGMTTDQMQKVARDFNFSESTFVQPADEGFTRKVRIFTPSTEVPFAGHPNIGTAFALANDGAFGEFGDSIEIVFDEAAGPVAVSAERDEQQRVWCELAAPQSVTVGDTVEPDHIAGILCLDASEIETSTHAPQVASVGLPFLIVELTSLDALQRAQLDMTSLKELRDAGTVPDVHLYTRCNDEFDIRARMFAPLDGVPEDPATGSANCALAALLTRYATDDAEERSWRIAQGVEMGRPSVLEARTRRIAGNIDTWIGGYSVFVGEGFIDVY